MCSKLNLLYEGKSINSAKREHASSYQCFLNFFNIVPGQLDTLLEMAAKRGDSVKSRTLMVGLKTSLQPH